MNYSIESIKNILITYMQFESTPIQIDKEKKDKFLNQLVELGLTYERIDFLWKFDDLDCLQTADFSELEINIIKTRKLCGFLYVIFIENISVPKQKMKELRFSIQEKEADDITNIIYDYILNTENPISYEDFNVKMKKLNPRFDNLITDLKVDVLNSKFKKLIYPFIKDYDFEDDFKKSLKGNLMERLSFSWDGFIKDKYRSFWL